jgi:NitT/TauT family transport system substrate-binding protein
MKRRDFLRFAASAGSGALAVVAAPGIIRSQGSLDKMTLLIGSAPPDPAIHYYYYAKMNGFYEQEGLDVAFKTFSAETTALRGLLAGEGEVAWTGAVSTFQAIDSGAKVKCVSAITSKLDWVVVANKSVADLKQVAGKTFAVSQIGAASQIAPILMLESLGVTRDQVKWIAVGGSSSRVQALIVNKIDVTMLTPTFAVRALKEPNLHQIGDTAKDLSKFLLSLEIANTSAIESRPKVIKAFVLATARGAFWGLQNPDQAAELSQKILPDVPKDDLAAVIQLYARIKYWNAAAVLPRDSFDFTYGSMAKIGDIKIKTPITYNDFFFPDFAVAAATKLGLPMP